MPTIIVDISPEQLLHAVERLPAGDLDAFVAQVLALRVQRTAPHPTQREADLLLVINRTLPADLQRRYDYFASRHRHGTLTPDEHSAFLRLVEYCELLEAERTAAHAELARLRRE